LPMAVEGRYINTWIQYNTIQSYNGIYIGSAVPTV